MKLKIVVRLLGLSVTFATLLLFISTWVLLGQGKLTESLYCLISATIINYLTTIIVSSYLINAPNKSNLFIGFYLFIFLFQPYIGVFFYFLLGADVTDKSAIINYKEQMKKCQEYENYTFTKELIQLPMKDTPEKTFLYNYIQQNQPIYNNTTVETLISPSEHIKAIVKLIKNAKKFIRFEYYVFIDGHVLTYILFLLEEKVQLGVTVQIIVDDLANYRRLKKQTRKKIKSIGIQLRRFNPIFSKGKTWWQFRNHNKLLVVDNEFAMYGSCNIADEFFNITSYFFQTTELSVLLTGGIVNSLNVLFCAHWNMHKKQDKHRDPVLMPLEDNSIKSFDSMAQLVNSSPLNNEQNIKNNLIQLIHGAKKTIYISTPYFYPPKDIIDALKLASISGVKIQILVPKQADFANFYLTLNRQLFRELLNVNVKINEYFGFNHEKLMIIDDETTYFGSYNWDYRALYLNFESALLVKDKQLALNFQKFVFQQLSNSYEISKEDLNLPKKIISNILINSLIRLFKPFL